MNNKAKFKGNDKDEKWLNMTVERAFKWFERLPVWQAFSYSDTYSINPELLSPFQRNAIRVNLYRGEW